MAGPDSGILGAGIATLLLCITTVILFQYSDKSYFNIMLHTVLIFGAFALSSAIHAYNQYNSCNTVSGLKIVYASISSVVTTVIGLAIAYTSVARIPFASIAAPLVGKPAVIGKTVGGFTPLPPTIEENMKRAENKQKAEKDNSNVCSKPLGTLEDIEKLNPSVKGVSYAFYVGLAMIFGIMYGNSISVTCQ
jgi:hypothetical protein